MKKCTHQRRAGNKNIQPRHISLKNISGMFLLLLAGVFGTVRAQNAGDSVFADIRVHTINLRFPYADYWDSLTIYYAQGNEQEIPATAIVNETDFGTVGTRLKGNSSFSYPNNKKSFKINFDQYRTDLRWDGLKAVHLNNM